MHRHQVPLLRTKLHRPSVATDHVHRPRLHERLSQDQRHPVVLVSAPAGYGKSTLIACWLGACGRPSAWLSLDGNDDDPQRFSSCFVAAIQTMFPEALCETADLIRAPDLPPISVLAATLLNELDDLQQDFVLVLDDVHCIQNMVVHDLLGHLVREIPRSMQLVLIGRRDPRLPIASLRAQGDLIELRARDLRFTVEEATELIGSILGQEVAPTFAAELTQKAEGWVTGLRLALLSMRATDEPGDNVVTLKGTTRYVADYLISEILDRQPDRIRDALLQSCALDEFCAPLCDAVLAPGAVSGEQGSDGQALIDWLQTHNLFIINLDAENMWFRYHHLFREFLKLQLKRTVGAEEIDAIRLRASAWCEAEGLIEQSIDYALAAGATDVAADVVERHRDAEFDANRWHLVDQWVSKLPAEVRQYRPKLLLCWACLLIHRYRLTEIAPIIERVQGLFKEVTADASDEGALLFFRGLLSYWQGDDDNALAFLDRALELIPDEPGGYMRAEAEEFLGFALQSNGRKDEAVEKLTGWIHQRHPRRGLIWERLRFGLAVIHLLSGDLAPAYRDSRLLRDYARQSNQPFVGTWGSYLLGAIAFQRHDLEEARRHFDQVVEHKYAANYRAAIDSMVGTAIACELLGQPSDADQSLRAAHDHARWTEDESILEVAWSGAARLALLRGDLDAAIRWQRGFDVPAHARNMMFFVSNPHINECRVLAATGTKPGLAQAAEKLCDLRKEAAALHNVFQTIEMITLHAVVVDRQGRPDDALDLLREAVDLAEPGGWIRPFVELRSPMEHLLQQLLERDRSVRYAGKILAAFRKQRSPAIRPQALPVPLTWREQEILDLLANRLQNKEISAQLHISAVTVKSHLRSIYQKLNVERRREAVERAEALGILARQQLEDSR